MSTTARIGIQRIAVERASVISAQPFDKVLANLGPAIGHPDMSAFARGVVATRTAADLERVVDAAPMLSKASKNENEAIKVKIAARRMGCGREIATAVAFLLSDDASYIMGAHLAVDGFLP